MTNEQDGGDRLPDTPGTDDPGPGNGDDILKQASAALAAAICIVDEMTRELDELLQQASMAEAAPPASPELRDAQADSTAALSRLMQLARRAGPS